MRTVDSFEIVLSGPARDRLLLTFGGADHLHLPNGVERVVVDRAQRCFVVVFDDPTRREEVRFPWPAEETVSQDSRLGAPGGAPRLPVPQQEDADWAALTQRFDRIVVVGLSQGAAVPPSDADLVLFHDAPLLQSA